MHRAASVRIVGREHTCRSRDCMGSLGSITQYNNITKDVSPSSMPHKSTHYTTKYSTDTQRVHGQTVTHAHVHTYMLCRDL